MDLMLLYSIGYVIAFICIFIVIFVNNEFSLKRGKLTIFLTFCLVSVASLLSWALVGVFVVSWIIELFLFLSEKINK